MKKFVFGLGCGYYIHKKLPLIARKLEELLAHMELQRDILLHDNPDLR